MYSNKQSSKVVESIIDHWKKANPTRCHMLGIHDYDGELPNYSASYITKRCKEIETDLIELGKIEKSLTAEKFAHFEFTLLKMALETELFELKERQEFKENPVVFVRPLTMVESSYVKRSFASIDDRTKLIIKLEEKIPNFLNSALEILNENLSTVKISMAQQFLKGSINFYKNKLNSFIIQAKDKESIDKWTQVNTIAVNAMEQFSEKLEKQYLPKSHNNFALGQEKFLKLLRNTEHVDINIDKLLKIGEEDLERNYQQMRKILKEKGENYLNEVLSEYPQTSNLVKEAQATLDRTRQFVLDSKVVSVPTDEQCKVIETPEYFRGFAFAAMNTPGPLEKPEASEAYYYITPPDSKWTIEEQNNFLKFFNKAFLESVTIHEVWPGHYLQLLYSKKSKSEISKIFAHSTSMVEGWAHYCEEMIVQEHDYAPFDRTKLKVGQLLGALQRNCRYVSAIKMHCKGMTVEESINLFKEKAFLSQKNAEIEARRGTIDPMYLNYTLRKLLIKKLRSDYQKEKKDDFSLRQFHDELLSYGSASITALREVLINDKTLLNQIL